MANKLCCTADQRDSSSSPDLPAIRVSEATPKKPLLQNEPGSYGSRFNSTRSTDIHELRLIFDNAKDDDSKEISPPKYRFVRPSIHSLHSLQKVKSVHALIKRRFSKDMPRTKSTAQLNDTPKNDREQTEAPDTVIKVSRDVPNLQLKITKEDLRKDLFSNKKPEEGGYDSDAEVLDDIAKGFGKKTPNKRTSLHSIEWTPSPGSRSTSTKARNSVDLGHDNRLSYQVNQFPRSRPITPARFTSSPNLRSHNVNERDRNLRRSHSATSIDIPIPSSESVVRLPSLLPQDTVPWSVSMTESLRLSHFPAPPTTKPAEATLQPQSLQAEIPQRSTPVESKADSFPIKCSGNATKQPGHIQGTRHSDPLPSGPSQPAANPVSTSGKENVVPADFVKHDESHREDDDESNPRHSVHLYSMRISHHLRSGSLLSWDQLADADPMPSPPHHYLSGNVSEMSRVGQLPRTRHDRNTSSSGFASSRIPARWGKVLKSEANSTSDHHRDDKSSIYSSRPQTPPDSFGGSMGNLSMSLTNLNTMSDLTKAQNADHYPTDDEETPRPTRRYGLTNLRTVEATTPNDHLIGSDSAVPIARNNSVAHTKKSKFREEFSPSPPKKKSTSTTSLMRFLRPRNSFRSQSETKIDTLLNVDGPSDALGPPGPADSLLLIPSRESRHSKSMVSLETEHAAAKNDNARMDPTWARALKSYQDERSSMFLTVNKDQATHSSPFRERSGSIARAKSIGGSSTESRKTDVPPVVTEDLPTPGPSEDTQAYQRASMRRRTALVEAHQDDTSPSQAVRDAFNKQDDGPATVGAWGRYPSHTRFERAESASHLDSVTTRDFALEAAIKFAMGPNPNDSEDIDPATRPLTPADAKGRKRKKRVGSDRMAKSKSMTFGKQFLKNYAKIFRSSSTEFQKHGRGHRSSIAAGGMLNYPELEILPEVWRRGISEEISGSGADGENSNIAMRDMHGPEGKQKKEDSEMMLRPRKSTFGNSNNSGMETVDLNLSMFDGAGFDIEQRRSSAPPPDRAKVWSVYYEDCVPEFPRPSLDADFADIDLADFAPCVPPHAKTMPARLRNSHSHSRAGSRVSGLGFGHTKSRGSAVPRALSNSRKQGNGEGNGGEGEDEEERSMISVGVRKSTMDFIHFYREQERVERERVLSLVRLDSVRGL
ncbi:hypothetical protein BCR34DRAFT_219845 [Clohesyomyces aquaticus]|uniref:Uncharacterized protein n=1 Tax=Clohesyomyces aquaticus TaxID=1231657 RepID=A0A1Y1Y9U2_9PLEO|nr:hypothetical protein BCR34DRAFT_219845 [Clohesyomyces aquaticus]